MSGLVRWIDRTFYPQFDKRWDDQLFREMIAAQLRPDDVILDLGAGRGLRGHLNFRDQCRRVIGTDVDPAVLDNPYLHEARLQQPPDFLIPADDATFDVVFCNSVLEHVANPETFFREVRRVLKPGGIFLGKTPNKHHYVAQLARLTPNWFHEFYNRLLGRDVDDTFPTLYRCNTRPDLERLAASAGLIVEDVNFIEGRPEYLRLTAPTYLAGLVIERTLNGLPFLKPMRCVMYSRLRKPATAAGTP